MQKFRDKSHLSKSNLLFSYHYNQNDLLYDLGFELFEELSNRPSELNILEQPEQPSPEADSKIGVLEVKTDVLKESEQVEANLDQKISKTSEYFANTKFATKINTALQQLGSNETAESFMNKIDKLFVDLMSREFSFLPDQVRNNLGSSIGSALLSGLYNKSEGGKDNQNKPTGPTKSQAIGSVFNSLTGIDFNNIKDAPGGFDFIKQVLSIVGGYDLIKNQVTKISYMLDMIILLKKEDRAKNLQFDRSESIINDPSKFVSTLNSHDTTSLLNIKKDEDKSKMIGLFFSQPQSADMEEIGNKLGDTIDDKTAQAMVKSMDFLHINGTKLMNNRDVNKTKFKGFYETGKNILSQVEGLAQAFGMGTEETAGLRSVLNWVFMIFTGKRFDSYEEDEMVEKYKIDDSLKNSLEKAKTDYLTIDPNVPVNPLDDKILNLWPQSMHDMIAGIDKEKLATALTTNITLLDNKLVVDTLGDNKTGDIKQDIGLLLNSENFWKKITTDEKIIGYIKDGGGLVYLIGLLLGKGESCLEGVRSGYIQIPYIKQQPIAQTPTAAGEENNPDVVDPKTPTQDKLPQTPVGDIESIKTKKINQLTRSERKLLFDTVFGDGPATQFIKLMDQKYGSNSGNIYLNILALAKHEGAQRGGNWRFGSDIVNPDTGGQTAMGTFQISVGGGVNGVKKKYNDLINEGIKYINGQGIGANYDLSKYSNAQKDLLTFIAHTNRYTKKGGPQANREELSSKLFDNTRDAKFMSDIQRGISAIGQGVATQIQKNSVNDYV